MGLIIAIVILGISIGLATFFIVRNLIAPKKIARVEQLIKQGKYSAAIKTAKQIVAGDPRNPDAHYMLGQSYLKDGKPELALMEYKTVNEIGVFEGAVNEVDFRRQMADLFERFNQPDEALKEYLLLIQKEPNSAETHYRIGYLFEQRNKAAQAVNYYRKTVELAPRHGNAHLRLGMILYRAKKLTEARTFLEKALKFQPDHYDAYYFLGKIYKENKQYMEALQALEWATKSQAYKIRSLIERGTAYMEMNNLDQAVPELERAIKLAPDGKASDVLWARYFLATCYERNRRIERAVEQWEAIYEVESGFQDVAEKLGHYQDLRQNDHVKDFLTAGQSEFRSMCEEATKALGLVAREIADIPDGCSIVAEEGQTKWRNTRKQPRLIWFLRVADLIDENTIRDAYEEMRNQNMTRAIVVASANFSRTAVNYAESRPIDLVNKDKLQQLLTRVS